MELIWLVVDNLKATESAGRERLASGYGASDLRVFVFALFFIFGGITSLNDIIIPKRKELFTLSYGSAMLVQSAYFPAYALFSIPAAAIVGRMGYMRTAAIGLVTMTAGCLLFIPASSSASFRVFLLALVVLAAGVTIVQVVANPLISLLGQPRSAHSRLTFAQAFNSLGTTIFPLIGSAVILGGLASVNPRTLSGAALDAYRAAGSKTIVAAVVWTRRNRLNEERETGVGMFHAFTLLSRPRFAGGTLCIFLYGGAEVAIGSFIVNYRMQPSVLGLSDQAAGARVPFYWGGALLGRFVGAYMLAKVSPGKVLAAVAAGAIALMNSIMFPTIFSLASEGLGKRAAEGFGVIATAIVGGAIVSLLTGKLADTSGSLHFALLLPALCYAVILAYGLYAREVID